MLNSRQRTTFARYSRLVDKKVVMVHPHKPGHRLHFAVLWCLILFHYGWTFMSGESLPTFRSLGPLVCCLLFVCCFRFLYRPMVAQTGPFLYLSVGIITSHTATQRHSHSISSPSSFLRPISVPLSHIRHSSLPSDTISPLTLARVSSNRTVVCSTLSASTYACSKGKSRATSN